MHISGEDLQDLHVDMSAVHTMKGASEHLLEKRNMPYRATGEGGRLEAGWETAEIWLPARMAFG